MTSQEVMTDAQKSTSKVTSLFPDTIRFLAVDAAQKAGSGHPGAPMGMADMGFVLWDKYLKFDPESPRWADRDRFVLSAGHSCLLLYSLLHLYGYDLPIEEVKNYRQWGSLTPGHPEFGHTPGVESTTGPLGQGVANAVGMALAERIVATRFNRPDFNLVDHFTYVICSDGDLMEGVSAEASSMAGHQKLGKLIVLYDDNRITIGGSTEISFTEDVGARYEAYGWHVQRISGHDHAAISEALKAARDEIDKPSMIIARTHIGFGSPNKQDTPGIHGSPLGEEEVQNTKKNRGWPQDPAFLVPPEVRAHAKHAIGRGQEAHRVWQNMWQAYEAKYPDLAAEWTRTHAGTLPEGWDTNLPVFKSEDGAMSTRGASGKILNAMAKTLPELVGGSADLEPSNMTLLNDESSQSAEVPSGRNIHFGVREHAMGSLCNGMAYHGGVRPYNGTFLIFSDYQRPAVRLAALVKLNSTFIYTHDSIALGADGPTHQPIEHLMSLRAIPGLTVIRPADANETRVAWQVAMERPGPVALILTRQNIPVQAELQSDQLRKGAYVVRDGGDGTPEAMIIATGSELALALEAADVLSADGVTVQVVNMPSWELFEEQPREYKEQVMPASIKYRLAVEAGATMGWWKYVGSFGDVLGIDQFGASAPGDRMLSEMGFTVDEVVRRTRKLL